MEDPKLKAAAQRVAQEFPGSYVIIVQGDENGIASKAALASSMGPMEYKKHLTYLTQLLNFYQGLVEGVSEQLGVHQQEIRNDIAALTAAARLSD